MLQNLILNFCLVAALLGWGQLFSFFNLSRKPSDLFLNGILGFLPLSFLALVFSLVGPLNEFLSYYFWFVGWALLLWQRKKILITPAGLAICFTVGFFIVGLAVDNNFLGDSLLYHIQTLLWIKSEKIVLGLANVHDRFGMNSIWHLVTALVSPKIEEPNFVDIATSSLMILTALFLGARALENYRQRNLQWIFYATFIFSYFVIWGKWSQFDGLGSPGTDVPASLFSLVVLILLWEWISDKKASVFLLLLIPFCLMVKLSQVTFVLIWVPIFYLTYKERFFKRESWLLILALSVFCGLWVVRNFLLSGCLIFPQPGTCASVPWALPLKDVISIKNWIESWAKMPGLQPEEVLGHWRWLKPWSEFMIQLRPVQLTLFIISLSGALILFFRPKWQPREKYLAFFCIGTLIVSFWLAPNPRFFISTLVGLSSVLLFKVLELAKTRRVAKWLAIVIALVVTEDIFRISMSALRNFPIAKIQNLSDVGEVQEKVSDNGVVYFQPKSELCGFVKTPCVPLTNPSLAQGDLWRYKMYSRRPPATF